MPVSKAEAKRKWNGNYKPYESVAHLMVLPPRNKSQEKARRLRQIERGTLKADKQ